MDHEKLARINAIRRKHGLPDWEFPKTWKDLPEPHFYKREPAKAGQALSPTATEPRSSLGQPSGPLRSDQVERVSAHPGNDPSRN